MAQLRWLRTAGWTVLICASVLGVALLFAQDQETLRISSAVAASDERFASYAATLTGSNLTEGDRYTVLVNGVEFLPAMLEAINAATTRISFETYIYDTGRVADAFTAALESAARRGVRVQVLADAVGASGMRSDHIERLRSAGAEVAFFNPLHWYSVEEVNYRTHRKILVIDGTVGFTGGAGVADHWEGDAGGPDHWRDTQLRVTGPAVSQLEGAFYENWAETGHEMAPAVDLTPPPARTDARSLVVWSSPTGGANRVKLLYLLSIAAARRTLDIQSPYVVLDESTRYALFEARRRGVRIRLLVESESTDAPPVKYASRAAYADLLAAGIEIHEYQPTMMHVKALVVDGAWSIIGSTNFDNRSLELNDEVNVGIASQSVAETLTADFEADLERSKRLNLEEWTRRPVAEKAREKLWSLFGELF